MVLPVIAEFTAEHVGDAAELLARRQVALRSVEPLLPRQFDKTDQAEQLLSALLSEGATGVVAYRRGTVAAYLLGVAREDSVWGPNVWMPAEAAAAAEADLLRDVYAGAAQRWVDEGRTAHYALIPAQDAEVVRAWSHLCFGVQHVHAALPIPLDSGRRGAMPSRRDTGVSIRPAVPGDAEQIAPFGVQFGEHLRQAPVFSRAALTSLSEALVEERETLADPALTTFVAEHRGRVVGAALGCDLTQSSAHSGLARLNDAAMFAWVFVDEAERGHGVGRELATAVIDWAQAAGYGCVVTDWRSANLPSSRAWPPMGFRATFLRMHRLVGY
ncbi:MAG: GNAT family N-acetyltransferase [Actinomycetes bacterium]